MFGIFLVCDYQIFINQNLFDNSFAIYYGIIHNTMADCMSFNDFVVCDVAGG